MTYSKSLIIGASGMVGSQMLEVLGHARALPASRSEREDWVRIDLAELNESSKVGAALDPHFLDAVYCVGGMTYVDGCEAHSELAWRTNARGPGVLAAYARQRGLPFVFFSTEYVFGGSDDNRGPYLETSQPNPLNVYGKTKLEGEERVLQAHPDALVVRTTVVYGPDPGQKNYLYSLLRNLSAGKEMRVPQDQISTPTYNRDLIQATFGLVKIGASGIFNVCGPDRIDRLAFATTVAQALGLPTSLLSGVSTQHLGQLAQRPLHAGLAIQKLERLYPTFTMRSVDDGLRDCAQEILRSHRMIGLSR